MKFKKSSLNHYYMKIKIGIPMMMRTFQYNS